MNRNNFLNFIEKYNLSGEIEQVKISSSEGKLKTKFANDSKNMMGEIEVQNVEVPDCEFGVFNTSNLVKALKIFNNEVDFNITEDDMGNPYRLLISDEHINGEFVLADTSVINKPPNIKNLPEFEFEFELNDLLLQHFKNSRSAMEDGSKPFVPFAFVKDGSDVDIVMNYSSNDVDNTVTIPLNISTDVEFDALTFNADLINNILTANKDFESSKAKVSSQGLLAMSFTGEDFRSMYLAVMLDQ